MNTPAQLRLAADILETGHPWGFSITNGKAPRGYDTPLDVIADGNMLIPLLARPPYPATLHNPDNLTAEQVGAGYRLALKGEPTIEKAEVWRSYGQEWDQIPQVFVGKSIGGYHGSEVSIRIPLSVPWPEKPDEIPWTEWHGGECPLKDEEVEEWQATCRNGVTVIRSSPPSAMAAYWSHDQHAADIIAYRVLKTREPKPKVPLGPEDVTPFTLFRVKLECGVVERVTSWITPLAISTQGVKFHWPLDPVSWTRLARDYERNNSLETGKWDATKWEACEK